MGPKRDDDDNKLTKSRKTGGRSRNNKANKSFLPSEIVCTTSDLSSSRNSMEFAVVLSLLVLGLYFYGFIESMKALPDITTGRHVGTPLNLAKLEPDNVVSVVTALSQQQQQQQNVAEGAAAGGGAAAAAVVERVQKLRHNDEEEQPAREMKQQNQQQQQQLNADGSIPIPEGKWPVSIRGEENDYETLIHVGDNKTVMKVPKFWSPPLHNKQLFTREQAMKVGTCIEPDPVTGSMVRGDDCPPEKRTIYIGLASYRDYQCRYTLESAFLRAAHPERIRVGT